MAGRCAGRLCCQSPDLPTITDPRSPASGTTRLGLTVYTLKFTSGTPPLDKMALLLLENVPSAPRRRFTCQGKCSLSYFSLTFLNRLCLVKYLTSSVSFSVHGVCHCRLHVLWWAGVCCTEPGHNDLWVTWRWETSRRCSDQTQNMYSIQTAAVAPMECGFSELFWDFEMIQSTFHPPLLTKNKYV